MARKKKEEIKESDFGSIIDSYLGDEVNSKTDEVVSKMHEAAEKNIPHIDGSFEPDVSDNVCDGDCDHCAEAMTEIPDDLEIEFDKDEFERGLKDASYYVAQVVSFMSIGVDPEEAMKFVASMEDLKISRQLADVQKDMAIECARLGANDI